MPGLNRRGPNSEGAMTGRRMGRCNPDNKCKTDDEIFSARGSIMQSSEVNNRLFGKGSGRRLGRGHGQGSGQGLGNGKSMRHRGNA